MNSSHVCTLISFLRCVPGWDCPWFANTRTGLCETKTDLVNEPEIYRTAKACCEENFPGSASCEYDSLAVWGHPSNAGELFFGFCLLFSLKNVLTTALILIAYPPWAPVGSNDANSKPQWFFPDLSDNNNCLRGNNYEDWMLEEGFSDYYLFVSGDDCCKMW